MLPVSYPLPEPESPPSALCPYCQKALKLDVIIRCPVCQRAHHLGCFADHKGCSDFSCTAPHRPRAESVDALTEGLLVSQARREIRDRRWNPEKVFALLLLLVLGFFFALVFGLAF